MQSDDVNNDDGCTDVDLTGVSFGNINKSSNSQGNLESNGVDLESRRSKRASLGRVRFGSIPEVIGEANTQHTEENKSQDMRSQNDSQTYDGSGSIGGVTTPMSVALTKEQEEEMKKQPNASSLEYAISPGKSQEVEGGIPQDDTVLISKQLTERFKAEQADTLEQDLISSKEKLDELTLTEFEPEVVQKGLFISENKPPMEGEENDSNQAAEEKRDEVPLTEFEGVENDSQEVENDGQETAEDMVPLGSMGCHQQEELNTSEISMFKEASLDDHVDPNSDPSDLLMSRLAAIRRVVEDPIEGQDNILLDDLAVSDSEDEESHHHNQEMQQERDNIPENDDGV